MKKKEELSVGGSLIMTVIFANGNLHWPRQGH